MASLYDPAVGRFNEAGAFPPRKYGRDPIHTAKKYPASMRPGRFHPGNLAFLAI